MKQKIALPEKMASRKSQENRFLFVFIVPTLILFIWFVIVPTVQGLYYSLFSWSGISSNMSFIGVENYQKLIKDPIAWISVVNDLKLAALRIIFTLIFSLILSLLLTRTRVIANGFFRNVIFFPVVLSTVVICAIWMMMYNSSFGAINKILAVVGIKPPAAGWLGDQKIALYAICPPEVWCSVGFYMIIFISAIEGIPAELYESAKIDGANVFQQTFQIILPLIKPQINFCVVYSAISSFGGAYQMVDLLTQGGPNNATMLLGYYMKVTGFTYHKFGYSTAVAMLMLAVTAIFTVVLNKVFKSEAYEY